MANGRGPAGLMAIAVLLASPVAYGQPAGARPRVENAYVTIYPAESTEPDFVLALERGIELVLCEAGVKSRADARERPFELKLAASLTKADYETDPKARELVRECALSKASATLPGGASVALPDLSISGRTAAPRSGANRAASESFFLACGANFARGALDALKDQVSVRGSSCEAPAPQRPRVKPRR